jgi:hypothetical protein
VEVLKTIEKYVQVSIWCLHFSAKPFQKDWGLGTHPCGPQSTHSFLDVHVTARQFSCYLSSPWVTFRKKRARPWHDHHFRGHSSALQESQAGCQSTYLAGRVGAGPVSVSHCKEGAWVCTHTCQVPGQKRFNIAKVTPQLKAPLWHWEN